MRALLLFCLFCCLALFQRGFVAADDSWLGPASGRATATLSVHQAADLPFLELFRDLEPLLRSAGGRPHWGKWHGLGPGALAALYPDWDRFLALRAEVDPEGRLLDEAQRRLLLD